MKLKHPAVWNLEADEVRGFPWTAFKIGDEVLVGLNDPFSSPYYYGKVEDVFPDEDDDGNLAHRVSIIFWDSDDSYSFRRGWECDEDKEGFIRGNNSYGGYLIPLKHVLREREHPFVFDPI